MDELMNQQALIDRELKQQTLVPDLTSEYPFGRHFTITSREEKNSVFSRIRNVIIGILLFKLW